MIDHFGGSDRRYPDPAVWRTLPAKILPVCGTAGRCGNQRSEASSRLRRPGCLPFAGVAANMCSSQKIPRLESQGRCENTEIGSGKQSAACAVRGVRFYRCVCPHVFFAKNWQEDQGGYGNAESGAEVCPSPALSRVFAFTGVPAHMRFPHKKIPRRESRGIFIRHLR